MQCTRRRKCRCCNDLFEADHRNRIVIKIEVLLTPDGRLAQPPRVINSGAGALFADNSNSAVRALVQCEPYDLPPDYYKGGWDHMVVTFDPQRMFRGGQMVKA